MSPVKSPEQHSVGKTNKIVPGKVEADELPPGWTMEVKTRKSCSKTKIDRSYTDPVTGYTFYSLKDVDRYLKSGLKDVRYYKPTQKAGIRINSSTRTSPLATHQSGIKTPRATRQAGIKIDSPPDTRNSRQAATSRLDHLVTSKEKDEKTQVVNDTNKHDANDSNCYHKQETSIVTTLVNHENFKEHDKDIKMGPATLAPVEAPSSVVPPVDLKEQDSSVVNSTVNNPIPQDGYGCGANINSDSSIPCGVENPSPSPLKVPLEELWTDPCIEFAVKTLTGAIPVGEDDHLQHQPAPQGMSIRQTDVLWKHFETGQKRQQQQDSIFSGNIVKGQMNQCSLSKV